MHQSVFSAFPAKRLIIKRVRAVVPQETQGLIKRKKTGKKQGGKKRGERLGSVTRGRTARQNWKNDILCDWRTQRELESLDGVGGPARGR
jgi:hypothetical protein